MNGTGRTEASGQVDETRAGGGTDLPTAPERVEKQPGDSRERPARFARTLKLARRPSSVIAIVGLCVLVVLAIFGPIIAPHTSELNLPDEFLAPSAAHLFGTDELGRDVLGRVIVGTRDSVISVASVLSIALIVGTAVGAIAGYLGGLIDEALMRLTDMFLAFPPLILALAIAATLGAGFRSAIIAIGAVWWPTYARLVRGQVLATKSNDYVDAARALGVGRWRILYVHVLRNCMTPVIVQLTLDMGNVLVTFAGLSYLGVGAPPGSPEWGATISDGQQYLLTSWWIAVFPGLALYLSALSMNLFGEFLGDVFMPARSSRLGLGRSPRRRRLLGGTRVPRAAGTGGL
jgi:peptide/nickel transport system permease protein